MRRLARLGVVLTLVTATAGCSVVERARGNWWELSREPSGQSPDPATTPEAIVRAYAAGAARRPYLDIAQAFGRRGVYALRGHGSGRQSRGAGHSREPHRPRQ